MKRARKTATSKKPAARRRPARKSAALPHAIDLRANWEPAFVGGLALEGGVAPETAIRVTSIFAVVRFIAQAIASMPVQLMRTLPDGRREPAALPCSYVVRKRPNGWQSAFDFYQLVAYWTALHGNAFARVIPGERGFCSELRPLHPTRVRVKRFADYSLGYEFFGDTGSWQSIDASQILHWRWISDNGYVGLPPSELCGTSVALARKLDTAASAFWDNSARPDLVVTTKQRVPDEAVEALRRGIRDMYGGARNRGSAAIMPPGTELKPIESNSNEASQFMQLRDAILPDVARCWGVPSTLLGDARMARWSNVEQEHLSAQVWCLLPWQRRMEGPIDMMLQPVYGEDLYTKFDSRGLLRADTASRVQLYQGLFNMGALKPQELRDMEDLPLLDDPAAEQTYMQLGFSTLQNAAAVADAPMDQPAEVPAAPADQPTTDTVDTTDPLAAAASGADLAATALNGAQVTALLEVLNQIATGTIDKDAAVALITAAFPTITEALAGQMVDGTNARPQDPGADPNAA